METQQPPYVPSYIAGMFVLSGIILVGTMFGVVWEVTGVAGVLGLAELSIVVAYICRENIIGDML